MRGDDSGENISEKNPQYCELTPQYWAWKNENFDFAGFFHYRRYLSFDRVYPVAPDGRRRISAHACPFTEIEDIRAAEGRNGLAEARMREIIPQYDLITVMRERINTSVYRQYIRFHDREPLTREKEDEMQPLKTTGELTGSEKPVAWGYDLRERADAKINAEYGRRLARGLDGLHLVFLFSC